MPSLTISFGSELYLRLQAAAEQGHRSLDEEIIHRLEQSLARPPVDVDTPLAEARALRDHTRVPALTDEALRAMREEGRA